MYGAILGDMIGAPYEFDRGDKTKDFPLLSKDSRFTDDTVMTIAVAEALLDTMGQSDEAIKAAVVRSMQKWGKKYPHAGYMEGNTLYAHRSWTGVCVFILRFDPGSDEIRVTVDRHPEQYAGDSIQEDEATINDLLDWWCQPHYDYYSEWMSETLRTLEKQGRIPKDAE